MLKFVVLAAAAFCAVQADDAVEVVRPAPDPKACKLDYLKDAKLCVNLPQLLEEGIFEKCGPKRDGMKGFGRHFGGGEGGMRVGGRRSFGGVRPESDVAPGEGQLEAMRSLRGKREARRGGKNGKFQKGPKGPGCFNCMMQCVFNTSGFLNAEGNVDIEVVKTKFVAKASNEAWGQIIKTNVDDCWGRAEKSVAPPAPVDAGKKQCKHQPTYFMQCIQRALALEPTAEKVNNATDCDARVEHLKNCDPMVPGQMDFSKYKKGRFAKLAARKQGMMAKFRKMRKNKNTNTTSAPQ